MKSAASVAVKSIFAVIGSAWLPTSAICPPPRQSGGIPRAPWPLDPTSDNVDNRRLIASGRRRTSPEKPVLERARTAEEGRLEETRENRLPWKLWGPYLSECQWGTVREDYSETGDAWNYFTHDHARLRAITGVRTVSPGSAMTTSGCALLSPCGTARIQS